MEGLLSTGPTPSSYIQSLVLYMRTIKNIINITFGIIEVTHNVSYILFTQCLKKTSTLNMFLNMSFS